MTRKQKLIDSALRADLRALEINLEGAPDQTVIEKVREQETAISAPDQSYCVAGAAWQRIMNADRQHICQVTGKGYREADGATIGWSHLRELIQEAVDSLPYELRSQIPYNLSGEFVVLSPHNRRLGYPYYASQEGVGKVVSEIVRFCGWLRAAAKFPGIRKVILKTQSSRGTGSPYNKISLTRLVHLYPSPGHLERTLWKVKTRARQILAAFDGFDEPSWLAIAKAVMVTDQVGKAAVIAAAYTVAGTGSKWDRRFFHSYREAREWLTVYHEHSVTDNSDGVQARRRPEPSYRRLGIAVYDILVETHNEKGYRVGVAVRKLVMRLADNRTYHSSSEWGYDSDESCVREALAAWKRQDQLIRENADLVGFLKGEKGFCPLIYREDSYSAGNCDPGTASWLRERGWGGKTFIPGPWLIPYLDQNRVRNVAAGLYRNYAAVA